MDAKIKVLKIIHFALLAGLTLAYFIIGDLINLKSPKLEDENLYYIFIPAIAVLVSNFVYKKSISKIDKKTTNDDKMVKYQSASIKRWAILEAGAFLILILKPELVLFGLLLLVYLLLVRPTKEKIENELDVRL
ncbi:MFS transporter [uncultured Polaribacter sp.]|uniref:MFS transporter n=1 Tax=uncultured Polaribacter sp. TaxID=174711 RepID=UPI00261CD0A7|nr:MFS transporter [uncultured Polaribacter sp.]